MKTLTKNLIPGIIAILTINAYALGEDQGNTANSNLPLDATLTQKAQAKSNINYYQVSHLCINNLDYPQFTLIAENWTGLFSPGASSACLQVGLDSTIFSGDTLGQYQVIDQLMPKGKYGYGLLGLFFTPNSSTLKLRDLQYGVSTGYKIFDYNDEGGYAQRRSMNFPEGFARYKECAHLDSYYEWNYNTSKYIANIDIKRCDTPN